MFLKLTCAALLTLAVAAPATAGQEHMHGALKHLQAAHKQLAAATHDKGGHRTQAMNLIEQAIKAIEEGIAFDRTHNSGKRENKR